MATASAMGRPPASGPLHHQEEPSGPGRVGGGGRCIIHFPYSKRTTTRMTHWNHQANHRHQYRWASTVQVMMEDQSIQVSPHLSHPTLVFSSWGQLTQRLTGDMVNHRTSLFNSV
ncbi:hypothetical protein INR49_016163 [Caranx melampygus]|nr:hypothetical protein INR49_016163 [Caranx melampygus]